MRKEKTVSSSSRPKKFKVQTPTEGDVEDNKQRHARWVAVAQQEGTMQVEGSRFKPRLPEGWLGPGRQVLFSYKEKGNSPRLHHCPHLWVCNECVGVKRVQTRCGKMICYRNLQGLVLESDLTAEKWLCQGLTTRFSKLKTGIQFFFLLLALS